MDQSTPRRALVSVSDKSDLDTFARGLADLGFEIVSTGGTRRYLEEQGLPVIDISTYTGFPEIMDGRVKTLHPKVHGAILGRPDLAGDAAAISEHGIIPFELVVCNLYPFEETVARADVTFAEAVEQIDIGGPSMVRSAAKNHAYVAIVSNPSQYERVLAELRAGKVSDELRRELMLAAFEMTARNDRAIAEHFGSLARSSATPDADDYFPDQLTLRFNRLSTLRYGENPHQQAAFYAESDPSPNSLAADEQIHGKELSYNNILDLDSAISLVNEFGSTPAAVVIKHNNPCGCAIGETQVDAFEKAYAGDPVSAFGSILAFNTPLDIATAEQLCEPNRFIEAIFAPGYSKEAFEALTTRPKWKNSVRLLQISMDKLVHHCPSEDDRPAVVRDYRRVSGGMLVQDRDEQPETPDDWKCVTEKQPSDAERRDLDFAWRVCKHVKSNAIVLAKGRAIVGVGAGQMSRVDSSMVAVHKAGERSGGAVVASDAFFPFRDGVDQLAESGVTAVIQPGGSRGDEEVIAACNEHNLSMLFTGRRHFRH